MLVCAEGAEWMVDVDERQGGQRRTWDEGVLNAAGRSIVLCRLRLRTDRADNRVCPLRDREDC